MLGIDADAHPDRTELGLRPDHRRHPARARSRGLWVIATNPAHSWINQDDAPRHARPARLPGRAGHVPRRPRRRSSPTCVLPAAGWGEKEGTFINSERRIGLIKKVARAPGQALADFSHLPARSPTPGAAATMFDEWTTPEAVFQILKRAVARASRATSPASTTTAMLDEPRRHPVALPGGGADRAARSAGCSPTAGSTTPTAARGSSSRTPRPMPEPPDAELSRSCCSPAAAARRQWHTQTRTSKSAVLRKLYPRRALRRDQSRRRPSAWAFSPTSACVVESRRGTARGQGVRDPRRSSRARSSCPCTTRTTNRLTLPAFDPYSRQPSYKACAVRISPLGRRDASRTDRS